MSAPGLAAARYLPGQSVPAREWVLKGLLGLGTLTGWIGPEKSQKSLFALRLAMHIACGKNWHSYSCEKPRKVVYFDAENPMPEVDERYREVEAEFEPAERTLIAANLAIFQARELIVGGLNVEYGNTKFWEWFVIEYPGEVYILDSLYMFHSKPPTDNEGLREVLARLRKNCGSDKCVVVLHHTRKRSDDEIGRSKPVRLCEVGIRRWSDKCYGGGAFKKYADIILGQEVDEEKNSQKITVATSIMFQAYGRIIEDSPTFKFEPDGQTKFGVTLVRDLSDGAAASLATLQKLGGPWKSKNDAAKRLGVSRSQGNLHINELIGKLYLEVKEDDGSISFR